MTSFTSLDSSSKTAIMVLLSLSMVQRAKFLSLYWAFVNASSTNRHIREQYVLCFHKSCLELSDLSLRDHFQPCKYNLANPILSFIQGVTIFLSLATKSLSSLFKQDATTWKFFNLLCTVHGWALPPSCAYSASSDLFCGLAIMLFTFSNSALRPCNVWAWPRFILHYTKIEWNILESGTVSSLSSD